MMLYFIQVTGHCGISDRQKFNPIADFYSNNKPVAFVCHSPEALKSKVNGEFLVRKKNLPVFKC
jgi:hypothetical protein